METPLLFVVNPERRLTGQYRLLGQLGFLNLALCVLFMLLGLVDDRQLLGVNIWLKPFKFALTTAIFLFTFNWLLPFSALTEKQKRRLIRILVVCFMLEVIIITVQSWRGQRSHFNITTIPNALLFSTMGIAILVSTVALGYLLVQFFRQKAIPGQPLAFLWSIRWGLLIFLVGCLEGGYMSGHGSHSVGTVDGGPGLMAVNWSTVAGDLRIAHFISLHALQVIPLLVWWAIRRGRTPSVFAVTAFSMGYLLVSLLVFVLAYLGMPLIRL